MVGARLYHSAVLLGSGKVLIVSGAEFRGKDAPLDLRAELYDPASGTFAATGTPVSINAPTGDDYVYPTATLLQDGRALVTWTSGLAELYDPRTGVFSATGTMIASREYEGGTQTLLANGTVLITGGLVFGAIDSAEIYDPSTETFRPTGKMTTRRGRHTATLLRDGTVLIAGANQEGWGALGSTELYDPETGAFSARGSLATPRYWHTATLLDDGNVLMAGGIVGEWSTTGSAELYTAGRAAPVPVGPNTPHDWRASASGNKVPVIESVPDARAASSSAVASAPTADPGEAAQPTNLVATASGSGVVLTWIGPRGAAPVRYAISGGRAPHTSTLPVIVTADASNRYTIPALPPGSYFFTVFAVLADGLSPPSNEAAVAAAGSWAASGPPSGALAVIEGGFITATWTPAPGVGALYEVEIGRGPGQAGAAVLATTKPSVTYRADAATSYLRVRSVRGATVSAPSNDVSVSAATVCAAAPLDPVLLPPSTTNGETTISWLPAGGSRADYYRVDGDGPSGPTTKTTLGAGTSLTADLEPGTYSIRVTAINACGASAASNAFSFTLPDRSGAR